jgi:hypothetical protein
MTKIRQIAFRQCWPEVLRVIKRPDIQAILAEGLADYAEQYPGVAAYAKPTQPWTYCHGDHWEFNPRPRKDTPEWFMAYGLCHWLCDWQAAIGQILMPELEWDAVRGPHHSTAVGFAPYSDFEIPVVVLDILRETENPADTLADARRKRQRERKILPQGKKPWVKLALQPDPDPEPVG